MKRLVLILLLVACVPAFAGKYVPVMMWMQNAALAVGRTATVAGNWSATTTWSGSTVPVAGDAVDLNGFVVVDDIVAIPDGVGGTLLSLTSPAKAGQLTVALTAGNNVSIAATTITCGTVANGFILVSGVVPLSTKCTVITATLSAGSLTYRMGGYNASTGTFVLIGNVNGGTGGSYACGIHNNTTGGITGTGTATGGSTFQAIAVFNNSTGPATWTGNLVGGTGSGAAAFNGNGIATITLASCSIINGTGSMAYSGYPPTTWNTTTATTITWAASGGNIWGQVPAAANLETGYTCGGIAGTLTYPTAAQGLSGYQWGRNGTSVSGTYVSPVRINSGRVK